MSEPFHLKQFDIYQDRSALKVGTDGMLLGAIVADRCVLNPPKRVLDIGTGTGIIALMLAQVFPRTTQIVGIEIDTASAEEATQNALHSPFSSQVTIINTDLRHFTSDSFDLIVSNPPFFTHTHSTSDERSTQAKHSISLSPECFFGKCQELLTPQGSIATIIATSAFQEYKMQGKSHGFSPIENINIVSKVGRPPKRIVTFWQNSPMPLRNNALTILQGNGRHSYTPEYARLLRPYLIIL